jgi:hypothetical protein
MNRSRPNPFWPDACSNYPNLFERDESVRSAVIARVVEAFGLDLPARVPAHHREDSLEKPPAYPR